MMVSKTSELNVQKNDDDKGMKSCPFCNYFLESNCKEDFIPWYKCVQVRTYVNDTLNPFVKTQNYY